MIALEQARQHLESVKGGDIVYHRRGERVFHQHGDKETRPGTGTGMLQGQV